jgi:hypothetical protein
MAYFDLRHWLTAVNVTDFAPSYLPYPETSLRGSRDQGVRPCAMVGCPFVRAGSEAQPVITANASGCPSTKRSYFARVIPT